MAMLRRSLFYAIAAVVLLVGMRLGTMAQQPRKPLVTRSAASVAQTVSHNSRLAPTLPPRDFSGNPVAEHAYAAAARIEPLLRQLPSYCGHGKSSRTNLLSLYQTRNASACNVSLKETFYAFQQSREGKTVSQIRRGIIHGNWRHVNLSKWRAPLPSSGL
jgi:hypothetical protein